MGRNYKYNLRTGVVYKKVINTKKTAFGVLATAGLVGAMAVPALAASAPSVSDNASANACFGQARAWYAQGGPNGVLTPNNNGFYISQRKGDNPANNAAYIATYCE